MVWDYAEQSRRAREAGGPEAYANQLIQDGKDSMQIWIYAVGLLGTILGAAGMWLGEKILARYRKKISEKIQVDKELFIEAMNEQEELGGAPKIIEE